MNLFDVLKPQNIDVQKRSYGSFHLTETIMLPEMLPKMPAFLFA